MDRTTENDAPKEDVIEGGQWYGVEPLRSLMVTAHLVTRNPAVPLFSEKIPWPHHCFYANHFHKDRRTGPNSNDVENK